MSLIDLTNYSEHPTQPNWLVFRFPTSEHAQEMVRLCESAGMSTESDVVDGPPFMVGVHKRYATRAEKLNYQVLGKFRKPFIPNVFWRWTLIAFFVVLMAVAIIGMMKG